MQKILSLSENDFSSDSQHLIFSVKKFQNLVKIFKDTNFFNKKNFIFKQNSQSSLDLILKINHGGSFSFDFKVKEKAKLKLVFFIEELKVNTEIKLNVSLLGKACDLELYCFLQPDNFATVFTSKILHLNKDQFSKQEFKGVNFDGGKVEFQNLIKMSEKSQGSESLLDIQGVLSSLKPNFLATPNLMLETEKVKSSHQISTIFLKQEELFYFNCRGISQQQVKKLYLKNIRQKITKNLPLICQN